MSKVSTNKLGNYYGAGSVEISPPAKRGESGIRRLAIKNELVKGPQDDLKTMREVLIHAASKYGDRDAYGWRDIIDTVEEEKDVTKVIDGAKVVEKKQWKYFQLSDYKWMSFNDIKTAVSEISRGLLKFGISKGEVFNIYAQTSPNWQLIMHGCSYISITIATAYDTLGEDGLIHSLKEPECVAVFTNANLLPTLLRVLPQTPTVRLIVYDGQVEKKLLEDLGAVRDTTKVLSLDELRALGRAEPTDGLEERAPKKEDTALIMYTSGSTGNPKGVVLTHANLLASIGGMQAIAGQHFLEDDTYLAYLPLAHVLEFIVELYLLYAGIPIGYGRVKTLTDASVRNCKGDIGALCPSLMVGVPAVWETIRKGILTKVNASGTLKKAVFHGAVAAKRNNIPVLAKLADKVLAGVQAATGGRLRLAISGGSALSRETQEFLSTALVTLVQGYGMTESCGMCAALPPELHQYDVVGLPVPSIEVKLLDARDAGYLTSGPVQQGEICIRGPSVTSGYYKRPDLNEDENVFTKDGWLRTGDIGQWNPNGTLTIIDRLKNLIKLQSGEYIALERLEAIYKSCNLVGNICVYATQQARQPMAIVIPHPQHLQNHLADRGMNPNRDIEALCRDHHIREIVRRECNLIGRRNGFKPFELLQAVILTPEEWTPENGLVTAAQKIQRAKIANVFRSQIDTVYEQSKER